MPTHISEHAHDEKRVLTALRDTSIYPRSDSASRTKYQKIQNDRKYKHQFVFQVYNILFTKIGWEEKGLQPHILSWGDYFASSSGFFFLTIFQVAGEFLQTWIRPLEAGEARRRGAGWGGAAGEGPSDSGHTGDVHWTGSCTRRRKHASRHRHQTPLFTGAVVSSEPRRHLLTSAT